MGAGVSPLRGVIRGAGAVHYDPVRADLSRGFGPHEVHPQMVAVVRDGAAMLEHNGDWIVSLGGRVIDDGGGQMTSIAFTPARGGRESAERLAALRNEGETTRVVDLDGKEHVSQHTAESVRAELEARGDV